MTASDERIEPTAALLQLLDLSDADGANTDEEIFVGISEPQPHGRVFGGQVLAQSILAAVRTVDEARQIHSMHGYFLRPGDANAPITFGVQKLRDGRSFSARRTHAYQNGVPILSMIASFQVPADGVDHHEPFPEGIPDPESLPSTADLLSEFEHPIAQQWAYERPFDIRHVQSPLYLRAEGEREPTNAVWMKSKGPLPDDLNLHRAALAYASDYTLLEPILRRHGIAWISPGIKFASLDHAMWWHRPFRADEWLLYVQNSPSASGARGLGVGRVFSRSGELVATVAQEGMMRIPVEAVDA
ncbi:acyl-CoA thioesterase [Arthrobacter crystallopoietes]|jgi:acyl-CoA thioesterase II|uniref:Acyl-CoA thioesterase 2 n=1 Tax=Crystallibacter crystallopoietes TaxID=37928 RepID=A0A1H1G9V1_9MICC|nr:acyl-CoA thioesterase II [Arthrobacter crystallopoietes]AUI52687.1 acyl-CoA thioesterase II [Arthrobacter crystallopoietes]SDR09865.1 acyl-CoA thioesterase-2 [Arthrobacter crystallopoietes]